MEIKQKKSRSCRADQGNLANPEQHFLQDSVSKFSRTNKSPQSVTTNQKSSSDTRQKVPNTSKYQLNIRKNQQCSPADNPTPSPPPSANGGLLQELTFDQSKGQFLWAPEGYQGNSKKRRLNGGSLTSSKPYDVKVPRPPNAFIIYHRTKSKELAKIKSKARTASDERHPSKTVAEMWREESEEVKLQYQREADLALVEHKKKYPYYKYRPKKKDSKNKCSISFSSTDSGKVSDSDELKDASQVPIEHRKQASMESAFSVFDLQSHNDPKEENDSNLANAMFTNKNSPSQAPDFPGEQAQMTYQSQCPNCSTHNRGSEQKWDYPLTQVSSTSTNLQSGLSNSDFDALLYLCQQFDFIHNMELMPPADSPVTPTFSPAGNENFTNLENQFSSNINSINVNVPAVQTTSADIMAIPMSSDETTQSATNWNNIQRYIIPSQSTSIIMPPQAPPPTPTSPVEFLSWTSLPNTNIVTNTPSQLDNQHQNLQLPAQSNNNVHLSLQSHHSNFITSNTSQADYNFPTTNFNFPL
ncbi:10403_t:CDS:2 [Scutellospora calospora]|uniref:10403_t:CDS:1 n=1 Tax=Scutellospora calospora TaxID=85575 RepID=A0ACA9KGX7_9GLOM|nr:10403_t:CDS:2 [Scutellospora calospora]